MKFQRDVIAGVRLSPAQKLFLSNLPADGSWVQRNGHFETGQALVEKGLVKRRRSGVLHDYARVERVAPLIVQIAGPSGSGKSTVATAVANQLELYCLKLDDYYIPRSMAYVKTAGGSVRTFERPSLYNGAQLAFDAAQIGAGCVMEGFCLFSYPQIVAMTAHRFYIDLPFATCFARRMARTPRRPSDRSFEVVGEQETETYVVPQKLIPGVVTVDGRTSSDEVKAAIISNLHRMIA